MDTLFIDRKDTCLDTEAGRLLIRTPGVRPLTLPLRQLRHIVLSARVELSTTVLLALNRAGITLVITHPMRQDSAMVCGGPRHGNINRRIRQTVFHLDADRRLDAARRIISKKLLQQYRALARHRVRRPDLRRPLTRGMTHIRNRWHALPEAHNLDVLRGVEGAAAAAYFAALATVFASSWGFVGRKRRPPPDPVNAVLSLTYTLLQSEAVRALLGSGLDTAIGALHDPHYNRDSLACDLMELLRTACDDWTIELFRRQTLRPEHFQTFSDGRCLMNKQGRAIFYPLYQQEAVRWRARLRTIAANWAREVEPASSDHAENHHEPSQSAD